MPSLKLDLYDFDVYNKKSLVFAIKDKFFAWGNYNKDASIKHVFISENKETVDENYTLLEEKFPDENKVFAINPNFKDYINGEFKQGKSSEGKLFFPHLHLYIASLKLADYMYKNRIINIYEYEIWKEVNQIFSSEKLAKARLILFKSSIDSVFKQGLVFKADGVSRLYGESLKKYLDELSNLLNSGTCDIIDDTASSNNNNNNNNLDNIIYADEEFAFLLRFNIATPFDYSNIFYQSYNEKFTKLINLYLKNILDRE